MKRLEGLLCLQWFLTVSPADGSVALAGKSGWRGVEVRMSHGTTVTEDSLRSTTVQTLSKAVASMTKSRLRGG